MFQQNSYLVSHIDTIIQGGKTKMKRKNLWILALALMTVTALTGIATAHMGQSKLQNQEKQNFHEQMEEIMEEGAYSDLEKFREEIGFNMMPWVKDEETFKQAQEMHKNMEENGHMHGKMMGSGMMVGGMMSGGCNNH